MMYAKHFGNLLAAVLLSCGCFAGDISLEHVLIEGEDWEKVVGGMKFCDACCTDNVGDFYYSDFSGRGGIKKVDITGKVSAYIPGIAGISAMQFGPDGRLYACQGRNRRIVALKPGFAPDIIVSGIRPNDLVVTVEGHIYFTETSTRRVYQINPKQGGSRLKIVAKDIAKPNGIVLSADGGTLLVSDHMDKEIWFFRIEKDGSLSFRSPYASLRLRTRHHPSKGDGMAVDAMGCFYVTSDLGLQMFDPTGRMSGVIHSPQSGKPLVSVVFAGKQLEYIYVANGDAVYRRKVKSKGLMHW